MHYINSLFGTALATLIFTALFADNVSAIDRDVSTKPNIILIMADDLGYGDTGFNGNKIIQTPNLDQMAREGVVMTNFYAGAPVCSPTRGSVLTGRHPFRYGIFYANVGHLPAQEITLPEMLKNQGYTTGHFGKWHLGTLSRKMSSKGKKRKPAVNFSPPSWHGYDHSFVTESAVTLWNPGLGKRSVNNPFFEDGVAIDADDLGLKGGASRVVMDKVLPFIESAVQQGQLFFTVIWYHAPHEDIVAGPEYLAKYEGHGEAAHYYGVVTEMDESIGRLRAHLKELGVNQNTLISFTSDNGPESHQINGKDVVAHRRAGSTDGLRGRKRSLYEGGVRVPTLFHWPGKIRAGRAIDTPTSTLDYLPTISAVIGESVPDDRPVDGVNILPLLLGDEFTRELGIPFYSAGKLTLIESDYKLVMMSTNKQKAELYHLETDRGETDDIAKQHPDLVKAMLSRIDAFKASVKFSHQGGDYNNPAFKPVDQFPGQ